MVNKIEMVYFSGSGNTETVVRLLGDALERRDVKAGTLRMEEILKKGALPDITDYDMLGVAYPIYAFNAAEIVFDFLEILPQGKGKKVFIIFVAGDPCFANKAGALHVRRILENGGYRVFNETLFAMPANIIVRYPDGLIKQLHEAAARKVKKLAEEIVLEKEKLQRPGPVARILSGLSKLEAKGARDFGKRLLVSENCSLCGECVQNCPRGNIYREDNQIKFDDKCITCMRCIYNCPQKAIYSKTYKAAVLKDGYNTDGFADNPGIRDGFVTEKTRGYYRHFYKYLSED